MNAHSTGLELILNAAEGVLQIAVTDNEVLLCAQQWHRSERATEILAPALRDICAALEVRLADFRRIACVRGPGSFTGIRLVLTTAAALRRTGHAQLAGLDYMQALATSAVLRRGLLYGTPPVLTHARRNLVHCQPFRSTARRDSGPAPGVRGTARPRRSPATPGRAAGTCLRQRSGPQHGALLPAPDRFRPGRSPGCDPDADPTSPDIAALCLLARHGDYFPRDLEPLYVRPCDAVENLAHLARRQGLDADEAVSALDNMLARAPESENLTPACRRSVRASFSVTSAGFADGALVYRFFPRRRGATAALFIKPT